MLKTYSVSTVIKRPFNSRFNSQNIEIKDGSVHHFLK